MLASIPLLAWIALAAVPQGLEVSPKVAAVAPFVGDEVLAVVHLDLTRWEAGTTAHKILGKLAEDADLADVASAIDGRLEALKKAGATDLFLLIDPADMPGLPVVVAPLVAGADARAVAGALSAPEVKGPIRWPTTSTIRGAVVAGTPGALARVREVKPGARPELLDALGSAGDSAIRVVLIPSNTQRRAIEESFPTLPTEVGGGPIEAISRGMAWASAAISTEPKASLRLVVRARDADSAKALGKVTQDTFESLSKAIRANPSMAGLAEAIARMKPEASGDRVTLEADLEKSAALVSLPIRRLREAANRKECVDNGKQIGLAMHNYHSTHKAFPAAYVASKDGKPLLSWRVLILPFLDQQQELYKQFHLDEAWDSPHNKPLIARMPRVYACPGGSKRFADQGKTSYLTPRGPATMFPGASGIKLKDVTDGSSNTILVVDANDEAAVPWTKPDDWEVTSDFTTRGLFGHHRDGTYFVWADGSVRFFKATIAPQILQALTTRNGGEALDDSF